MTHSLQYAYLATDRELAVVGKGFLEGHARRHLLEYADQMNLVAGEVTITWEDEDSLDNSRVVRARATAEELG